MGHRRNERTLPLPDLVDLHHEWHVTVLLEPFSLMLPEDRWREGSEALAALNLQIQDVLHVAASGITDDGAIAEGARAPFHAPLEPADHLASRDGFGSTPA